MIKDQLKCKVIRLNSDKPSKIHIESSDRLLSIYKEPRIYTSTKSQHLYLISDREIKEGDWCIWLNQKIIQVCRKTDKFYIQVSINSQFRPYGEFKKIEAASDSSLNISLIGDAFIAKYVEKQGNIDSVIIEMEMIGCDKCENFELTNNQGCCNNGKFKVKTRKDNTVIISRSKEAWNLYELQIICNKAFSEGKLSPKNGAITLSKDWFEQNID